ncbi:unnamed protein product [Onchocerca ochengi]|uniref:Clathrin_bdg domain-containing protein n=1 Tax=Onchocerca ochengi TaxID=42157 RepID=A0A182EBJ4_ONCOC|nr:unnamed protein product [Onchocerca ochengi]
MLRIESYQNIKVESSGSYVNLSNFVILFLLLILHCIAEKSSSVDVLDKTECQQSSIIRSLSNLSFKLSNSKSRNFVDVTDYNDANFDSLTIPFNHFGMERITVSLSALDKEIETARCLERRSSSVNGLNRSDVRNLDLHEKSERIPHFCEDLSALMEEPLFDPSLSYFVSRQNTLSDHGSLCSEVDGNHDDITYVLSDMNVVKNSQNWQSVTNLSEIAPIAEMLCEQDFNPENLLNKLSPPKNSESLSSSFTPIGNALNFAPQVVKFPTTNPIDEAHGYVSVEELERQPELNEIQLKSERCSFLQFDAASPTSSSSSCVKFLTPVSGSSRELSVISEYSDVHFENEICNSNLSMNEPSLPETRNNGTSENETNHRERAIDVDGIVSEHRRWRSESRNVLKKINDPEERVRKTVPLRISSSRNGELSERCRSQMLLKEGTDFIKNWAQLEASDGKKNFSSSSPNVNEMAVPSLSGQGNTEQVARNTQLNSGIHHKEKYKWKEALPAAFGPHQIIAPVQRSSRTSATSSIRKISDGLDLF